MGSEVPARHACEFSLCPRLVRDGNLDAMFLSQSKGVHVSLSSAYSRCVSSPEKIKQVLASFTWPQDEGHGLWDHFFLLTSPNRLQRWTWAENHGFCYQSSYSKSSSSFSLSPPSPGCLNFSQLAPLPTGVFLSTLTVSARGVTPGWW